LEALLESQAFQLRINWCGPGLSTSDWDSQAAWSPVVLLPQEELQRKLNESQVEATRLRSEAASTTRKCSASSIDQRVHKMKRGW
jgi:hypothetical protein